MAFIPLFLDDPLFLNETQVLFLSEDQGDFLTQLKSKEADVQKNLLLDVVKSD